MGDFGIFTAAWFAAGPPPDPDTWEGRMSIRAKERMERRAEFERWQEEQRYQAERAIEEAERAARHAADPSCIRHFEGTCDVCHEPISLTFDYCDGIIDIGIDTAGEGDDELYWTYTWIRHVNGPYPDCNIYSSRVYDTDGPYTGSGSAAG